MEWAALYIGLTIATALVALWLAEAYIVRDDMSDTLPGSSWINPIWYRGYRIFVTETGYFDYVHDDYDGAPDSGDHRAGYARTVDEAKAAIDEMEEPTDAKA